MKDGMQKNHKQMKTTLMHCGNISTVDILNWANLINFLILFMSDFYI